MTKKCIFNYKHNSFFKNISTQTQETQPTVIQCNPTASNLHQSTPPSSYPFQNQSLSYLPYSLSFPDNQPVVPPTSLSPYETNILSIHRIPKLIILIHPLPIQRLTSNPNAFKIKNNINKIFLTFTFFFFYYNQVRY